MDTSVRLPVIAQVLGVIGILVWSVFLLPLLAAAPGVLFFSIFNDQLRGAVYTFCFVMPAFALGVVGAWRVRASPLAGGVMLLISSALVASVVRSQQPEHTQVLPVLLGPFVAGGILGLATGCMSSPQPKAAPTRRDRFPPVDPT